MSLLYHKSPTTGFTGAVVLVVFLIPPPVTLPSIARLPDMVPFPITLRPAKLPMAPFSMVSPPTTANAPVLRILPLVMLKLFVLKNCADETMLPPANEIALAARYAVTLALENVPSFPAKILTPFA